MNAVSIYAQQEDTLEIHKVGLPVHSKPRRQQYAKVLHYRLIGARAGTASRSWSWDRGRRGRSRSGAVASTRSGLSPTGQSCCVGPASGRRRG